MITKNKDIDELMDLVYTYLYNAKMDDLILEWHDNPLMFDEVLNIVLMDAQYELNFTPEQTERFLTLSQEINEEQYEN